MGAATKLWSTFSTVGSLRLVYPRPKPVDHPVQVAEREEDEPVAKQIRTGKLAHTHAERESVLQNREAGLQAEIGSLAGGPVKRETRTGPQREAREVQGGKRADSAGKTVALTFKIQWLDNRGDG